MKSCLSEAAAQSMTSQTTRSRPGTSRIAFLYHLSKRLVQAGFREVLRKLLSRPALRQLLIVCCRNLAHRVGRISPLNVENARQEDGPSTPDKSRLQRFREWEFKPLGLEPSPELVALSVGRTFIRIGSL